MAIIWKGSTLAHIESIERITDAFNGDSVQVTWVGPENAIDGIRNSFRNNRRVICRTNHDGPIHRAIVNFGSQNFTEGDSEVFDTWTVSNETLEKDIFQHPDIAAEADSFGAHEYRKLIEDALSSGDDLDPTLRGSTIYPLADSVLADLARGQTHFEDVYTVLRCKRVLAADSIGKFTAPSGNLPIYTTAQLPVPNNVLPVLPGSTGNAFPDNPPNARWGWKQKGPTCDFVGRKAEIQVEFVCAAWSFTTYKTDATGPFTF